MTPEVALQLLLPWLRHKDDCPMVNWGKECACGLNAVLFTHFPLPPPINPRPLTMETYEGFKGSDG
jgi:hypothetical protein